MNNQAANEAVALKLGWTRIELHNGALYGCPPDFFREDGSPRHNSIPAVPDYGNDLNAAAQARRFMVSLNDYALCNNYCCHLECILEREVLKQDPDCIPDVWPWEMIDATAAQHREAFLRTFGLWKDDQMNAQVSALNGAITSDINASVDAAIMGPYKRVTTEDIGITDPLL